MTFVKRDLQITFTLPPAQVPLKALSFAGAPTGTTANTLILSGLRASAKIVRAGGITGTEATLQIYGMEKHHMNQLSTLGMDINLIPKSSVSIAVSDQNGNFGLVFSGGIINAYFDASAMPQTSFWVTAQAGNIAGAAWIPPTSFKGPVDIITVMQSLATACGLSFHNYGVTPGSVMMSNPYYSGAARQQIQQIAREYGIRADFGNENDLNIMPMNGFVTGAAAQIPLVSKDTGLIGYPAFTAGGLLLRTVYNPSISFLGKIQVKSGLSQASGEYIVIGLDHNLDANLPNGQWFSEIKCFGLNAPILGVA